jgi:hypothetical protein
MRFIADMISYTGGLLASAQSVYWFFALFGTLVFFVQFLMTLFGFGGDSDSGTDVHTDAHISHSFGDMRFFTIRTMVAFLAFFGWGGVLWGHNGWSGFFAALASGSVMMCATAFLIFFLLRLQHSGNILPHEYIGHTGTVYLSIPAGRNGSGKVTVTMEGCTREISAVADESIPTGAPVVVKDVIDGKHYLVEKK